MLQTPATREGIAPRTRARLARWASLAALTAALCTGLARPAHAQSTDSLAAVVALDAGDLIVDVGSLKGATAGMTVELWRPLKVRHPVTGELIVDRFRIGTLRLTQVGPRLSLAQPIEQPLRMPVLGDVIVYRRPAPAAALPALPPPEVHAATSPAAPASTSPSAPTTAATAPVAPAVPDDPEARELGALFERLRGTTPEVRIQAYDAFVAKRPAGRFSAVLQEEARALRSVLNGPSNTLGQERAPLGVRFHPPEQVLAGTMVQFGIEVTRPEAGAVLHVRAAKEPVYQTIPMSPSGDGYYVVRLPAQLVKPPVLEYFIELVDGRGATKPLLGAADAPQSISVVEPPRPYPQTRYAYSATLLTDYADYNRLRHDDWASQTEGSFGIRLGDEGLRSLRSGFGVYRGAGGAIRDLDELGKGSRAIGVTYGYLEAEWGISRTTGIVGRALVGLRDTGISGGGQVLLRIGNDRETNLSIGGEVIGGVGMRGITQLELNTFPKVPIVLRTEVTNQPAGVTNSEPKPQDETKSKEVSSGTNDIGARAIVQVGYRFTPGFTASLRGSYQGRTINHAGPGIGAAASYEW